MKTHEDRILPFQSEDLTEVEDLSGSFLPYFTDLHVKPQYLPLGFYYFFNNVLPQGQFTLLLSICPKYTPSYYKDTCSAMFMAASFIVAENWK